MHHSPLCTTHWWQVSWPSRGSHDTTGGRPATRKTGKISTSSKEERDEQVWRCHRRGEGWKRSDTTLLLVVRRKPLAGAS